LGTQGSGACRESGWMQDEQGIEVEKVREQYSAQPQM
jgi:hypothetical protein